MKKGIFLYLLLVLILSCDENRINCSTVLCAGPPVFQFEIIGNNENVLENGTYPIEDISITGTDEGSLLLEIRILQFGSGEVTSLIVDNPSWSPQLYELTLLLGTDFSIPLEINMDLSEAESCCGGIPEVRSIAIDGELQSLNDGTFFTITLD